MVVFHFLVLQSDDEEDGGHWTFNLHLDVMEQNFYLEKGDSPAARLHCRSVGRNNENAFENDFLHFLSSL